MKKIFMYSFFDLIRSKWTYVYFAFYFILTLALFLLSDNLSSVVISLMNVVLMLVPLIATMFSVTYHYNSREFTELLLAQPVPRSHIFIGQYLGVASSLALSLLAGIGIPFLLFGILDSAEMENYLTLVLVGVILSYIFAAIAFLVALVNENRIQGFGLAILFWLLFAVIYDGLLLLCLSFFSDYPLETFALGASMFNPIDLSRILILLKLDISALMGYTGAVFQQFLGTLSGIVVAFSVLIGWIVFPLLGIQKVARNKDF